MRERVLGALAAAVLVVAAAACGGDDDDSSSADTAATSAEATTAGSGTTAGDDTTTGVTTAETTGGADTTSAEGSTPAGTGDPIVIGAAIAQSGGFELYDNEVVRGMEAAMDEFNSAGGVDGRMFELVIADHKTDVAQVESATAEVLDKGADVVVTTADYDFGASAALAAQRAGKVSMGGAGAPQFGKSGLGPLHFNVYQGTATEAAVAAQFAQSQGYTKPFLLSDTSIEYSKSFCELFENAWSKLGGTIAGKETFLNADPSIANQVSAVKSSDADSLVVCSYPPGGASALRQIRTGGIELPIIGAAAFDGTFWLEAIPDLSDFYYPAMVSSAGDDPSAAVNDLLQVIKPAGGAIYGLFGYEIIETVKNAMENNGGDLDGAALAAAIESFTDEPLLVGPTTYTVDCHVPLGRPMAMMQIQDGVPSLLEYITPDELPDTTC
jgi:branched-chain amino acid transport system substrate-binding protein